MAGSFAVQFKAAEGVRFTEGVLTGLLDNEPIRLMMSGDNQFLLLEFAGETYEVSVPQLTLAWLGVLLRPSSIDVVHLERAER